LSEPTLVESHGCPSDVARTRDRVAAVGAQYDGAPWLLHAVVVPTARAVQQTPRSGPHAV
jgi:hypothetical protein